MVKRALDKAAKWDLVSEIIYEYDMVDVMLSGR